MKRLNPLYLVSLIVTIFIISAVLLQNEKEYLKEKNEELQIYSTKAKEYKNLKENWINEQFVNESLDQILKSKVFSKEKVTRSATKDIVKVRIDSNDSKVLDNFLNKVLNKQFVIKKLELEEKYINLEIGIK